MKAVVFDFDGTMIDSERTLYESWQYVFKSFGLELDIDLWVKKLWTYPVTITPLDYLDSLSIEGYHRQQAKEMQRNKEQKLVSSLPFRTGIEEIIKFAVKENLLKGIVTGSSRRWVNSHLDRLGYENKFEAIVSKEDTLKHKPDPAPYLLLADRFGLDTEEIVVFEDTPIGIESAKRAGMQCIAYLNSITKYLNLERADIVCSILPEPHQIEELLISRKESKIARPV